MFELDKKLSEDSVLICKLTLCELRLLKDGDLTWFLLVPQKQNIKELYDLAQDEQNILSNEINFVALKLRDLVKPDKINIATIGNIVEQLHVHIIARYKNDRAWPNVVWGTKSVKDFDKREVGRWVEAFEK